MTTIHKAAVEGKLLSSNQLDKFRQPAGADFDIDQLDAKGRTPLSYGAWKGHVGVLKLLVNEGASVNKLGKGDPSALWYATAGSMSRQNRLEVVKFLLDRKAEVDERSSDGYTPLMKIIMDQRDPEIISILIDHGASANVRKDGTSGPNAIDLAERTKDPKVIKALKPRADRTASTAKTVSMIVDVSRFILDAVNSPLITDIANGVAKQLYQISGEDSPEIRNVSETRMTLFQYGNKAYISLCRLYNRKALRLPRSSKKTSMNTLPRVDWPTTSPKATTSCKVWQRKRWH